MIGHKFSKLSPSLMPLVIALAIVPFAYSRLISDDEDCVHAVSEDATCELPNNEVLTKCNTVEPGAYECGFNVLAPAGVNTVWVCPILCYHDCPDNRRQADNVDVKPEKQLAIGGENTDGAIYESDGPKTKTCYRLVPCRLAAEVSTLTNQNPESWRDCWIANVNEPGTPIAWDGANKPPPMKPKLSWCVPVVEPPENFVQKVPLDWNAVVENADCKELYGPQDPPDPEYEP